MRTNQPRGGASSTEARSQGRRHRKDWRGAVPPFLRGRPVASTATFSWGSGGGDAGPRRLPNRVRNALVAPVVARGDRRLPELDGVEIGARRVGVVLSARARLERLHLRAGLGVDRRLSE